MKLRLFVAVEIDDAVRALARVACEALVAAGVEGRFEAPEKLHVTLAFLGHRPDSEIPRVVEATREASAASRPFQLEFARLGAFPSERRPRVIWVGPLEENAAFTACANAVRAACAPLGVTFDHDATPHVTICRPKFSSALVLPALGERATLDVRGLTIFRSLPAGQTTRYEALERTVFPG